jgi:twitching motility protein PilT
VVGLRAALRQDPDVVVLGDLPDPETVDTAIKAAETGHLVIATIPTADVVTSIDRIVAAFPREEREIGRMRFAEALRAVVSQQLLPEKDEKGRVPAVEILLATPAVREALRDGGRVGDLRKLMAEGRKQHGSQTYEQHVADLIDAETISADTAKAASAARLGPAAGGKRGVKSGG